MKNISQKRCKRNANTPQEAAQSLLASAPSGKRRDSHRAKPPKNGVSKNRPCNNGSKDEAAHAASTLPTLKKSSTSDSVLVPLDTPALRCYKGLVVKYLKKVFRRYLLAVDILARVEKALDIKPAALAMTFFPFDPFEVPLDGSVDNKGLCTFIDSVINMESLPHAEWLPRLEAGGIDFARFYEEFTK